VRIPILNGVYTSEASDFRVAYPYNLVPVPVDQGISKGYLRPGDGIVALSGVGPGLDRGGINWNGICYRVMGESLVSVSDNGNITVLGVIPGTNLVRFDYSFDYLAIRADGRLFLYNGVLTQITDPDLGVCIDFIWVDGYFMSTDGEFIAVTELNDPFSVLTTKYGSSEADPDPVIALLKLHNEATAVNRYTIETFSNVGGQGFPFTRVEGALIAKGAVGTNACCIFMDNIGLVGGGRNEATSVYLASNGQFVRLATREIDLVLATYSDAQLATIKVEARVDKGHELLYIHLPDKTLVYDGAASKIAQEPVWYILGSGLDPAQYRARNLVWCYNKWLVGDPQSAKIGQLTTDVSTHWGGTIGWEFSTLIVYNEALGALFHELELITLSGRVDLGVDPMISTRYSLDGEEWSQPKFILAGVRGERQKKLAWLGGGSMKSWRIQKFNGTSDTRMSIALLDARLEPLAV
jgi:Phage stabilisation protein